MAEENLIFSEKDLYLVEHNLRGRSYRLERATQIQKRKMVHENMHLMVGMTFTANLGFPQLKAYIGSTDFTAVSYEDRNRHDGKNEAIHFFLDDYRFRDAIWRNLERTTRSISKFDYFFTPDLSLWRDLPTDAYNRYNIFKTRFVGAYWQLCGFNVIPTASWGGLSSFSFCFEGLPKNSVIAVSGMGNRKDKDAFNLWCYGIRRLESEKTPVLIIVYGEEVEVHGIHTPLKFIPCFIQERLRKL